MEQIMETFNGREVIRCMHCKLNQFVVLSRKCRRCHRLVEPESVLAELPLQPLSLISETDYYRGPANIPAVMRLLRNAFGFSQRQFAERMHCQRTYVSKVENGVTRPTYDTAYRLAEAFGITPYAFISLAEALAQ